MDWNWYLFSFEGRINRARFWLSFFILLGWMLFIMWTTFFTTLLVAGFYRHTDAIEVSFGIDEIFVLLGRAFHLSLSPFDFISLVANLFGMTVFMWICLAISIKRLHDRDRSGWWIVPFFVVPCFANNLWDWLRDSFLAFPVGLALLVLCVWGVSLALLVLCVWGFVEMGFLRGSLSSNRFGPNPLDKQQGRPRGEPVSGVRASGWDQTSEIEFAPHIGSPPPGMHVKRGHD